MDLQPIICLQTIHCNPKDSNRAELSILLLNYPAIWLILVCETLDAGRTVSLVAGIVTVTAFREPVPW